jgi:large subunit ribosomal protein L10
LKKWHTLATSRLISSSASNQRYELVGDLVALLQSPARNVISALQSGGAKIAGIVKTLSEKESAA